MMHHTNYDFDVYTYDIIATRKTQSVERVCGTHYQQNHHSLCITVFAIIRCVMEDVKS